MCPHFHIYKFTILRYLCVYISQYHNIFVSHNITLYLTHFHTVSLTTPQRVCSSHAVSHTCGVQCVCRVLRVHACVLTAVRRCNGGAAVLQNTLAAHRALLRFAVAYGRDEWTSFRDKYIKTLREHYLPRWKKCCETKKYGKISLHFLK